MARSHIAFPLALLLSVSPGLSSLVPLICCCDNDLPSFHFHNERHAHQDRDHAGGHAPEVSGQSPGHRHDSSQSHGTTQASDFHSMVAAGSVGASSSPCICGPVDLPTRQDVALLKASETNRTFRNLAYGHLASATQVPSEGLNAGAHATTTKDVCAAGPGLYVINHSFLI